MRIKKNYQVVVSGRDPVKGIKVSLIDVGKQRASYEININGKIQVPVEVWERISDGVNKLLKEVV